MKAVTRHLKKWDSLELIGASRRGSGTQHATHRLRLASAVAVLDGGRRRPRLGGGPRRLGAERDRPALHRGVRGQADGGRRLPRAPHRERSEARHRGQLPRPPAPGRRGTRTSSGTHRVLVKVPRGATTGPPRVIDGDGHRSTMRERLRIVPPGKLPERGSFEVLGADLGPHTAFFDGRRGVKLAYRFQAYGPRGREGQARPRRTDGPRPGPDEDSLAYKRHSCGGTDCSQSTTSPRPGTTGSELKAPGRKPRPAAPGPDPERRVPRPRTPRLRRRRAAVRRSSQRRPHPPGAGRVRNMRNARGRGGRRQGSGARLGPRPLRQLGGDRRPRARAPITATPTSSTRRRVHEGERVRTGETVGQVGKTGNARTVGCQLHFEVWPQGWERGSPVDPLPILKHWDGWS